MDNSFNPLVPRPLDLPTAVPLDPIVDLAVLDGAKIFAAPDDPDDWDELLLLSGLGYDEDEVARLRAEGVMA